MPPIFWASAMTWSVIVVLPEDSGPKTSTTRPRGKPPTPKAASNEIAPVGITAMGTIASFEPKRMIEPLPNCFSICAKARSIALVRSSAINDCSFGDLMKTHVAYTLPSPEVRPSFTKLVETITYWRTKGELYGPGEIPGRGAAEKEGRRGPIEIAPGDFFLF